MHRVPHGVTGRRCCWKEEFTEASTCGFGLRILIKRFGGSACVSSNLIISLHVTAPVCTDFVMAQLCFSLFLPPTKSRVGSTFPLVYPFLFFHLFYYYLFSPIKIGLLYCWEGARAKEDTEEIVLVRFDPQPIRHVEAEDSPWTLFSYPVLFKLVANEVTKVKKKKKSEECILNHPP